MMVVSQPVLPPTYEPDYPSPGPSCAAAAGPGAATAPSNPLPFPGLPTAYTTRTPSSHSPHILQQRPTPSKIDAELVVKSALPPTPDPSPPTTKVLFPVQMVALAPPAGESYEDSSRYSLDEGSASPPSSSDSHGSHSTNRSVSRPSVTVNTRVSRGSHSEVLRSPSPPKASAMPRSETQPNLNNLNILSRQSAGRGKAVVPVDKDKDSERNDSRQKKAARRQTVAAPTSVRMTESRSADSRARLRSTTTSGGAKLARYPTIANEYPSASAQARARSRRQTDTPPRIVLGRASAGDAEDLDFGGPGGLEAKLVLLGSQGVGKTSLILRLTTGSYSAIPAPASLDGSLYKRKLEHNGVPIKLQIWDTAGQERFRSMAPIYYRGAHVCILVYDISDRKSFEDVRSWLDELHIKGSKDVIIYVVGAKTDLDGKRVVSFAEARRTIRSWLRPPAPEPEAEVLLSPVPRSLFRSTSSRARTESTTGPPPVPGPSRARPHSMHGLASLMASSADFSQLDTPTPVVSQPPIVTSPSPAPTVHFPSSIALSSSAAPSTASASTVTSPTTANGERRQRTHRVSFHAPAPPSDPIFGTTVETATASTGAHTHHHTRSNSRFSISGVLGLSRTTSVSVSDAMSNLTHLAEANPVSPRSPTGPTGRGALSPPRIRTESSPMLSADLTKQRSEEWSGRGWGRGEGPGAAEALEEFGAVIRQAPSSRPASLPRRGRARGGSLGRDSRLYSDDPRRSEDSDGEDEPINGWGVEVEGVRLGEVSSLTGEGVEAMCRSISACLVERKDKIERERTLRHKNSVMLTDPTKDASTSKSKGRFACCV